MDRKPWRNSAPATQEFEEESEEEDSASDGGEEEAEEEEEEEEEEDDDDEEEEEKEKQRSFYRPPGTAVQEVSSSSSSETEEEEEEEDNDGEEAVAEVKSMVHGIGNAQKDLPNKTQSSVAGNPSSETESETEEDGDDDGDDDEEESPKSVAVKILAAGQKPSFTPMVNSGSSRKLDSKKKKEKEKGDGKRGRGLEVEKADESAVKKRKENGGGVAAAVVSHTKAERGMPKSSIIMDEEEPGKQSRKKVGNVNNHDHMPAKSASSVRKDLTSGRKSTDAFAEVDSENKSDRDATPKITRKKDASASENELLSPQKPKKLPQIWSHGDQMALAVGVLKHIKAGKGVPYKKGDEFWAQVSCSMECDWTTEQLCEKVRRMKLRYKTIMDRSATDGSNPNPKNSQEKDLFKIWKQIWGGETGEAEANQELEEKEEEKEEKEPLIVRKQEDINDNATEKVVKSKGKTKNRMKKPKNTEESNHSMDETEAVGDDSHHTEEVYTNLEKKEEDGKKKKQSESTLIISTPKKVKNSSDQPAGNQIIEEIRACCSKMLKDVETKCVSALENAFKSVSKPGANGYSLVSPILGMPLGGGNMMEIRLPIMDLEASALKRRWMEQQMQELKVFSDRLELMQEQCRIQQEQLEHQLGAKL